MLTTVRQSKECRVTCGWWLVVCQTDPITDGARPSQHGQPKSSVAHQEMDTKPYHLSFTLEAVLCPTGTL